MLKPLRVILPLGLAAVAGACATALPLPLPATQPHPAGGFTNSQLRSALYGWPAEDGRIQNACLRNSLVMFSHLQECGDPGQGETSGGELSFRDCTRSEDGPRATFLVRDADGTPRTVVVEFSQAAQSFSVITAPSRAKE